MSSWYDWSPCSDWCGIGSRHRRRLCILDGKVSNKCENSRFESETCYKNDCPIVEDIYNCCQVITIKSDPVSPVDGAYFISDTDKFGNLKYKHDFHEFYVYMVDGKWKIGSIIQDIHEINEIMISYEGGKGRSR
jgi:hypothetical protein